MKLDKSKKGISLIVLVITIVVMIILATAIILTLNSNNIVGKANEAKLSSDRANILEAASVVYAEYDLKTKIGNLDPEEISAEDYVKNGLKTQGFPEEYLKKLMISNKGDIFIVKIPNGFVASDIETEDDISEGLVIYEGTEKVSTDTDAQTTRNQYVWIPVPDISEFVRRDGYSRGVLQTYVSSGNTTEPYSFDTTITELNDKTGEYAEYAKMKASVTKYGGFYIARYEAGTTNQRKADISNGTSFKEDGVTPDVLSQKDKYPYNYVAWGSSMTKVNGDVTYASKNQGKGAVELARSVYPKDKDEEIVSTLCYGVQWDAVMNFAKNVENPYVLGKKYIENSTSMGWYYLNRSENADRKTGKSVDTNTSNMIKNMYDLGGNLSEWTMEANSDKFRVFRGGGDYGGSNPPSARNSTLYPNNTPDALAFRIALYLK